MFLFRCFSHRRCQLLVPVLLLLTGCATTDANLEPQLQRRRAEIAMEPRDVPYIGRRFHIPRTHFWGYLRRPGQPWETAKLVMMNESRQKVPDRLPELPRGDGPAYGYDHNREYRIWGRYTGRRIYDPNSNLVLPEFLLERWELKNASPGWLFRPNERFNGSQLLRSEPGALPQ